VRLTGLRTSFPHLGPIQLGTARRFVRQAGAEFVNRVCDEADRAETHDPVSWAKWRFGKGAAELRELLAGEKVAAEREAAVRAEGRAAAAREEAKATERARRRREETGASSGIEAARAVRRSLGPAAAIATG
jgi:hypothetical protein